MAVSPQLSVAPQFLPRSLRVADLAANEVTEIFPLTFGEKPALRYPWPCSMPPGSQICLGWLPNLVSGGGVVSLAWDLGGDRAQDAVWRTADGSR